MLCILAIYMAALICTVLTLFTSVILYEFLAAAYDVVSDLVRELEWECRCAIGRRNNHAERQCKKEGLLK